MTRPPGRPHKPADTHLPPDRTATFQVGRHDVRLWVTNERWHYSVDGTTAAEWFPSQVEAWTAGVTEADRLDRAAGDAGVAPGDAGADDESRR